MVTWWQKASLSSNLGILSCQDLIKASAKATTSLSQSGNCMTGPQTKKPMRVPLPCHSNNTAYGQDNASPTPCASTLPGLPHCHSWLSKAQQKASLWLLCFGMPCRPFSHHPFAILQKPPASHPCQTWQQTSPTFQPGAAVGVREETEKPGGLQPNGKGENVLRVILGGRILCPLRITRLSFPLLTCT